MTIRRENTPAKTGFFMLKEDMLIILQIEMGYFFTTACTGVPSPIRNILETIILSPDFIPEVIMASVSVLLLIDTGTGLAMPPFIIKAL